jgi:hypothetical protein
MTVWDEIDELLDRYDGHLKLDVATQCCWGGELRLGLTNPEDAPARSMVFYSVAGNNPAEVARRLLRDAEAWLASSGCNPLPPPRCPPSEEAA